MEMRELYFRVFYGYILIAESAGNEDSSFAATLAMALTNFLNVATVAAFTSTLLNRNIYEANLSLISILVLVVCIVINYLIAGKYKDYCLKIAKGSKGTAKAFSAVYTLLSLIFFLGSLALVARVY